MNRIVKSFERSQRRQARNKEVDDGLVLGNERVTFVERQNESEARKQMKNPDYKVSINFGTVQELAVNADQQRAGQLLAETTRTMKRLKLDAGKAKVLGNSPRFQGGRPSIHDIVRWLNDIDISKAGYKKDVKFLQRLHVTLKARAHEDVVEEIEANS